MSPALSSYPSSSLSQSFAPSHPYAFNPQYRNPPYQPPLSSLSKLSLNPVADWSVTLRDGLPTPPSDMSGVAFNPQLAPSTYAANKQTQFPQFSKAPARVPLANTVSNAVPNYLPPMGKDPNAMVMDTTPQKKKNDSVASYLQVPASINTSCNALTEFAAQVALLPVPSLSYMLTFFLDRMLVLVRKNVQTQGDRGKHGAALCHCSRGHSDHGIPEMGDHRSVDHTSQPKRRPARSIVYLPAQEIQHGRSWQEGK